MELYYFITGVLKRHVINVKDVDIASIADEACIEFLGKCFNEYHTENCEILLLYKGETYLPLCFGIYKKGVLDSYKRCEMAININEIVETIKKNGVHKSRLVPMPGQSPIDGLYQIEISEGNGWNPIVTGIKKSMGEDILKTASNRVILG